MRKMAVCVVILLMSVTGAFAQDYFGQNKMAYEKLTNFTETDHFIFYHSMNLSDPSQKAHFERQIIDPFENAYRFYSATFNHNINRKIIVLAYKSHSGFEGNNVIDSSGYESKYEFCNVRKNTLKAIGANGAYVYFLPEGVGAFAEPSRDRIVVKLDFYPNLNTTIIAHELGHQFQFDMLRTGVLGRLGGRLMQPPAWFMEGGADYWADKFNPYTRDDIRKMSQREAAANPEKDLPTWYALNSNSGDAYSMGAMPFYFIEEKFGKDVVTDFYVSRLKTNQRANMLKTLGELVNKKIQRSRGLNVSNQEESKDKGKSQSKLEMSPNTFDRLHREFWASKYAKDAQARPTPFTDNANFKSWSMVPENFPYPITSAVPSCDGTRIYGISINKGNVVAVTFKVTDNSDKILTDPEENKVEVLTPYNSPNPVEYLIAQELNVWPFNGSDLTVTCDGKKLAIIGRVGKDHAITLWDVEKKKMLEAVRIDLDQVFSPVFSKDGNILYFSASKNLTRSIYSLDLNTREVLPLTGTGGPLDFDTAPAISSDGSRLAFVSFVEDFQKLFILDLKTGVKEQITFGRFNDNSPSWSHDDKMLVYTSDEDAGIWSVHTLDLETGTVSQRMNQFGGNFTPWFIPGSTDKVLYTTRWRYDQYGPYIYPNFETFHAELREPVKSYVIDKSNKAVSMNYAFREDDLFETEVDNNQVLNAKEPPEKYKLYGRQVTFGYTQMFGAWGGTTMAMSNILEDKHYYFRMMSYGDFKMYDFAHLNQENQLNWGYALYKQQLPLRYAYWQPTISGSKYPAQFVLNSTWASQMGADFFLRLPRSKFTRFEATVRVKNKKFENEYGLTPEIIEEFGLEDELTPEDKELLKMYKDATGSSMSFVGAYVRDTGRDFEWGPLNGNKIRAQIEVAPPVGSLLGYTTLSVDARKYMCLGQCRDSLFAVRGFTSWSSNPMNGEVTINSMDQLRGYSYGSFIGNQFAYGSAELRFPLAELGINFLGYMPIRGILFADAGYSRFSEQKFAGQKGLSYGAVIQFPLFGFPVNYGLSWTEKDGFKDRKSVTYVGFSW